MTEPGDVGSTAAPPAPPTGGSGNGQGNPWEQRERLGLVAGFLETVKLFVTSPGEAFARTRRRGDYISPLVFAVLIGWAGAVISRIWSLLFGASLFSFFPGDAAEQFGPFLALQGMGFLFTLILAPVCIAIFLFLWSGILHLCLVVVNALGSSESGFEGSFRATSYASVAQLAHIVPIVGGLIAMIWSIFLLVVGLSDLHRTSQGKALAAVLIPVVLCCVCGVVAVIGFGGMIAAFFAAQR